MNRLFKHAVTPLVFLLFLAGTVYGQNFPVRGKVTDSRTGETLAGVNIVVEGTMIGTISDGNGNYSINAPSGTNSLVFSYVGYATQSVPINGRATIDVVLVEEAMALDELVVIGYGTQRRGDLTGAIAVADMSTLANTASANVTKALQGQVAGIQVQSTGDPGAVPRVKIRGITSFTDNEPLYVVDGVFAPINDLPMENIESVQVLKDASAAAIYGSRAANGVVIITTKRGTSGQMKVDYNGYYGWQDITRRFDMCNREEYQMLVNEATNNAKQYPEYAGLYIFPANDPSNPNFVDDVDTDWQDEMFRTGHINNQSLTLSGGNQNSNFSVNLNYFDQTGTVEGRGPKYSRYGVSVNSDHKFGKFNFGESVHITNATQTLMTFLHTGTMLFYTVDAIPTLPVYDPSTESGFSAADGDIHGAYSANVVGMNNLIENDTERTRLIGNMYGEYEIITDLKYKLSVSYERTDWRDYHFEPEYYLGWFAGYSNTVAKMDDNRGIGYTGVLEQTLSYKKDIGKLNITALAGHSALNSLMQRTYGHAEEFDKPYFKQLSNGAITNARSDEYQSRLISFFGRAILSYNDKYLLTATIRRDGSSRFNPNNRWGNFPSIALAWKVHNESFMSSVDMISQLKLRASYGVLGNQNIGDYRFQGYINPYAHYVLNGNLIQGASQFIPSSNAIKWEQSKTSNVGLDIGFLNNSLLVTAEYYIKKVDDLLGTIPTPTHLGWYEWESPIRNALSVKNQGFEFNVNYNKTIGDFTFSAGANLSTLKNEVLSLGEGINRIEGNWSRTDVGTEVGEFYGYVVEKIFRDQTEIDALNDAAPDGYYQEVRTAPGDFKFMDLNGDNEITEAEDRKYIGSAIPKLYFGFNFSANYKNFDLTVTAGGHSGNMVVNTIGNAVRAGAGYENYHRDLLDRWTTSNPDADRPRIIIDDPNHNGRPSAWWLEKGDYLRISNIEVGYTIPKSILNHVKISSLRIYASAQNAITFTGYTGYDPDFNNDGLFSRGTDNGAAANKVFTDFAGGLPTPRTLMLGARVSF